MAMPKSFQAWLTMALIVIIVLAVVHRIPQVKEIVYGK